MLSGSILARIREYYAGKPEAGRAIPCESDAHALLPSDFDTPEFQDILRHVVTAGGTGLSQADQEKLGALLLMLEESYNLPHDQRQIARRFPKPQSLVTSVRREQRRVMAARHWMEVGIDIAGVTYKFYFRDLLRTTLDSLRGTDKIVLVGAALDPGEDGVARRSHTFNSDIFFREQADVTRLHGDAARVLGVQLHADEAVVSWNGANYVYPVRALVINNRDGGGSWETVGLIPHMDKVVGDGKNGRARLAVSDGRNDLLQRCLAVLLRDFIEASENGVTVALRTQGKVFFVPQVVGLVVDQVGERAMLGLMGSMSQFNCSHCLVRRGASCLTGCPTPAERPVVSTLEAQLAAALARESDGRPRTRRELSRTMSALPFAPALGAVRGLGTGSMSLYRIVSFDTLHVWKLGVLRLLAQRLPAMLSAVCGRDSAVHGSVEKTLLVANLRGFELGRLCRASPTAPGCFVPSTVAQPSMRGRHWRHF